MFRRICHRFLCGSSIYYNTPDSLGYTKLHRAASNGQYKEVRRLVERGADVNIKTKNYGVTVVMEGGNMETLSSISTRQEQTSTSGAIMVEHM